MLKVRRKEDIAMTDPKRAVTRGAVVNAVDITAEKHCCFVIHAVDPYCFELLHIFSLPTGFLYRQRYDERWIHDEAKQDVSALVNRQVLVLFWDNTTRKLYPIRWGTITSAQQVGRIFYFEYRLGEMVSYRTEIGARNAQIAGFDETFLGFHPAMIDSNTGGLNPSVFFSEIGQHVSRTSFDNLTNWGSILDSVAQSEVFRGVEFLKLLDITEGTRESLTATQGIFHLKEGTTYQMRIFQIVPNPISTPPVPHNIELNAFVDQIRILRRNQRAVGKYDVLTYYFKVANMQSGEQTTLELLPKSDDPSAPRLQSIYIPIAVDPASIWSRVGRILLILASLVLVFIPHVSGIHNPVVGSIGMIGLILSLIGWRGVRHAIGQAAD